MAVTARWYGNAFPKAFNAEIDLDTHTIKCALLTSSYTPSQAHDYFNDVSANEVSGTGYTAGGATLAGKSVSYNTGTGVFSFDAADVSWSSSTITARYAVIYRDTGTGSTSPLLCYVNFGADQSSVSGTFTLTFNASGIVTVTIDAEA